METIRYITPSVCGVHTYGGRCFYITILNIMNSIKNKADNQLSTLKEFTFNPNNQPIRVEIRDNEPWFVAKDVCDALSLTNITETLSRLDDDEKLTSVVLNSGQGRQMWLVNESGLYNLIFQSRKPEAKAFRKWVTSEVLPTLRKTGRYELPKRGSLTGPRQGEYLDLRCEPYDTKWLGTTTVRVIEHEDVEWYSVGDILRSIQTGTDTMQAASRLRDANPTIVRKIFIFGNTHPAWFTTITGLRLLVSGSRKLKTRSNMLQLKEGGAR